MGQRSVGVGGQMKFDEESGVSEELGAVMLMSSNTRRQRWLLFTKICIVVGKGVLVLLVGKIEV